MSVFSRQTDIFNPIDNAKSVTIIGCGSIGSYTAITLAKLGITKIELYDGDSIELANVSNQYYSRKDIGKNKATVLKSTISTLSPIKPTIYANPRFFTDNDKLSTPITIVCTDNIESRRLVYDKYKQSIFTESLIDARMGGELLDIYCISKDSKQDIIDKYEESLQINNQELPCSARSIIYNISIIGGLIGNLVKRLCNNEDNIPYNIMFHLNTLELIVNW